MTREEILFLEDKVPEPLYEVVRLYYLEKITQKEIAKKKGISLYKVSGYLSRARYVLRKECGEGDYFKEKNRLRAN